MLGHRLWRERFASDAAVVGQTVKLDRDSYLVVGIAPPGFSYPEGTEVWRPLEHDEVFRERSRGAWYLRVIGRLRPGVALDHAREEVRVIAARLARQYPNDDAGVGGDVKPLHEVLVGDSRNALLVLLGAVGLGLFAALALVLSAVGIYGVLSYVVSQRTQEIGIRVAIGADEGRVVRLILGSGLRLSLAGLAIGTAASLALGRLLASQLHQVKPHDPLTFAVVPLLLLGIALAASYLPARRAGRVDPIAALRAE